MLMGRFLFPSLTRQKSAGVSMRPWASYWGSEYQPPTIAYDSKPDVDAFLMKIVRSAIYRLDPTRHTAPQAIRARFISCKVAEYFSAVIRHLLDKILCRTINRWKVHTALLPVPGQA